MVQEIDVRDFSLGKVTPNRKEQLQNRAARVSSLLPDEQQVKIASFNTVTGNPREVISEEAPVPTNGHNYLQRALDHVQKISPVLGFMPDQPVELAADPQLQQTSSQSVTVHLQQMYKGIPIFQATEAVNFAPDGRIKSAIGDIVSVVQELTPEPHISVIDAVSKAAEYVAEPQEGEKEEKDQFGEPLPPVRVNLSGFTPRVIVAFADKADQPTTLEAGPFAEPIRANLVWFPLDSDLRLCWEILLTMPEYNGQYRLLVDAEIGQILYCRQLMPTMQTMFVRPQGGPRPVGQASVFPLDGSSQRTLINLPRLISDEECPVSGKLPESFPDAWIEEDRAEGNSTFVHLARSATTLQGIRQNGAVRFEPPDEQGDDQLLLNAFYYCCYMHDFFYKLGFRELDGNFQKDNHLRGGVGNDRVDVEIHPGAVRGTANMSTPADGRGPTMRLGLVTSTKRHTALDSSVVYHEFVHGVTNRLVGGAANSRALEQLQSRGMGEGWGDYFACTINATTTVGSWVANQSSGIRLHAYDENFPDHFGMLGTGRYTGEEHNLGEIWCAALMQMNRNIGKPLALQLVVDALKLSPANPSFLDMRDTILRALDDKKSTNQLTQQAYTAAKTGIWSAFAKYGMGPNARSNGASLTGIEADFKIIADVAGLQDHQIIALKADNGMYASRGWVFGNYVANIWPSNLDWATNIRLEVTTLNTGKIALKADHGFYLARSAPDDSLIASVRPNDLSRDPRVQFEVTTLPNSKIALKADNGLYLARTAPFNTLMIRTHPRDLAGDTAAHFEVTRLR